MAPERCVDCSRPATTTMRNELAPGTYRVCDLHARLHVDWGVASRDEATRKGVER